MVDGVLSGVELHLTRLLATAGTTTGPLTAHRQSRVGEHPVSPSRGPVAPRGVLLREPIPLGIVSDSRDGARRDVAEAVNTLFHDGAHWRTARRAPVTVVVQPTMPGWRLIQSASPYRSAAVTEPSLLAALSSQ